MKKQTKVRTRKAAAKRFKVTKTGKVLHRSHYIRHKRYNKGKKRIRRLKLMKKTEGVFGRKIKQMMGLA
ncbi:MAG: bL35 family ribosomal protein [Microgenomates group bacterium]|jgi:large subunit ribosomal protein L35|nr:50S ribosomal protein L35 [Candidatus Woesebacteria bacterium]MBP6883540.1 50S ribosomal protein L35 [Candidatus Woesebacteria bacterium]QQR64291.1 MAG: 50S ribosomal protein L35 [Candidatus Roizmanbacteria bacterium]